MEVCQGEQGPAHFFISASAPDPDHAPDPAPAPAPALPSSIM